MLITEFYYAMNYFSSMRATKRLAHILIRCHRLCIRNRMYKNFKLQSGVMFSMIILLLCEDSFI